MTDKQFLEEVLMQKDVYKAITDNLDRLIKIIPEIKQTIGFDHKNPAHKFDVWGHTLEALKLSEENLTVRTVLLFHDLAKPQAAVLGSDGFLHYKGHQAMSSEIAKRVLTKIGFDEDKIEKICYLITLHDNMITDDEIKQNVELQKLRLEVQRCDCLAHSQYIIDKRMQYVLERKKFIENFEKQNKQ